MSDNLERESENYLDMFAGFSEQQMNLMPLGFRKIYIKKILSLENERKNLIYNQKYRFDGGPQGSDKPISKIVE